MIKIIRKIKGLLAVLLVVFTASGCTKVEEKKPIKISINVWPGYAHAFIAQEKGFFKKNHVDVELVLKKNITDSAELYKHGDVDGFFDVFADVIMIDSEGISTKVVHVVDYSTMGDVIIGKQELNSLADLKGKIVGFERINTFSHIFVLKMLENVGIKETDVQFENIAAMDVLTALEAGKIDAGHTWDPVTTQALKRSYKILGKAEDITGIITDVLAFHAKTIEERPDDIEQIVKSMFEAMDFVDSNKDEALKIMAKAEGMTIDEMNEGINGVQRCNLKHNFDAMKKTKDMESLYGSGQIIADFFLQRGQLSRIPNLDDIIESRFVNNLIK